MPLLNVVLVLIVVGVLLYLFNKYVTMIDGTIKNIINLVVVVAVVVWLLKVFGVWGAMGNVTVG